MNQLNGCRCVRNSLRCQAANNFCYLSRRSKARELGDQSSTRTRGDFGPVAFPKKPAILLLETKMARPKTEVQQGTLALMVLKTLDVLGPVHGYGIARRIGQISGDILAVNQGTLYPVLLRLEQEGSISSEWGASENNRRARYYQLTRAGRKQLQVETQDWEQTAAIIGRFFDVKAEDL